jgi:tRNA threonylcarbamoyladenosine biosynthesis protein TsaE
MKKKFELSEIQSVAQEVLEAVKKPRRLAGAAVIALSGDLGAGKTTLTQAIARELGVKEHLVSPTFVIMKSYRLPLLKGEWPSTAEGVYSKLIHIDAYRLKSKEELEKLGWQEIATDPQNLILIEWPEQVPGLIPTDATQVKLSHKEESIREIEIS